jgi:uncharacterized protein involved in outer membrane biogenesis
MLKKAILGVVVVFVVIGAALFFWARSILATDAVRSALAAQISTAIGQPVAIDGVSASIFPRVTVSLSGVSIGKASEVKVRSLDVGASLGALLSRRIESATLHVDGARITLPLPDFSFGSPAADESSAPVQLVSVDEVVLSDIAIASRGRTLAGDIDLRANPQGGLAIRRIALTADGAHIEGTGTITNLAGPVGTIELEAGALDLDQLMALASDFAEGSGPSSPSASPSTTAGSAAASAVDLTVSLTADRATMAGISIDAVSGRARLQGETLQVAPLQFGLFGGAYDGTLTATLGAEPTFSWKAALKNVDVAAVTAFAGSPGALTGRLLADVDLTGAGLTAAAAMKTARGTAHVIVSNGTVKNLALVKAAVAATSLDPQAVIASSQEPHDEPFSELGATLAVASGTASTQDLHFVSDDIQLDAAGALKLDGSAVNLNGQVQLSEALSKQAGGTLRRVAEQEGRITLPITITGGAGKYSIRIDAASVARRAAESEAKKAAGDAIRRGLGGLLGGRRD